jgi:hypothetical protein
MSSLSLSTLAIDFIRANSDLFIGYAICVLFPLPWLNRFILDAWVRLFNKTPPTPD